MDRIIQVKEFQNIISKKGYKDYKYLPEFIQKLLKFSPTYYYTELLDNFNPVYMLIQFGFLALFVTLILLTLKYKKVK